MATFSLGRILAFLACLGVFCAPLPSARAFADDAGSTSSASVADQNAIYAVPRSYDLLRTAPDSFPDFSFFLGLNNARNNEALNNPPSFVPQCSTTGIDAPGMLANQITGDHGVAPSPTQIHGDVLLAYQDLTNLLYRLRMCDFYVSVYAWNTRKTGHTAPFDYTWRTGCNSFRYEDSMPKNLVAPAIALITNPTPTSDQLIAFLTGDEVAYSDLYERVASCAAVVSSLTYPTNTHRFVCNYGSFIGAFITGYSAAFGHRWGGGGNSTQSEVTAIGTVTLATPGLCQK